MPRDERLYAYAAFSHSCFCSSTTEVLLSCWPFWTYFCFSCLKDMTLYSPRLNVVRSGKKIYCACCYSKTCYLENQQKARRSYLLYIVEIVQWLRQFFFSSQGCYLACEPLFRKYASNNTQSSSSKLLYIFDHWCLCCIYKIKTSR